MWHSILITLENGEETKFGPYDTNEELIAAIKPYCEEQVKLGNMTQLEADEILSGNSNYKILFEESTPNS